MIRAKMLANNEMCIIDNGKTYVFNLSGKCYMEDAGLIPKYTDGMLDLPIISVLSSNRKVEIAICNSNGEDMKCYSVNEDAMTCALTIQRAGGFLRMLRRDGSQDGITYNQLLFVYKQGTNLLSIINNLSVQEVQ